MSMDQLMALVPIEAASATKAPGGRRSRWERPKQTKGKTKWGALEDRPYIPPPFVDLPPGLTPAKLDQFLREQRLEDLSQKLARGELEFGDPDIRAQSPPPVYDRMGNRTNTRDVRVRNAMQSEHQRLMEYMVCNLEGFVPPGDYKPMKKVKRIMIPQEKYPEYNFMGLIIGPRGCNHKRLEAESGAQISIRGKGTQKEGKKSEQTDEEAAMPQHVHIAADSDEKMENAVNLIEPLLDPFHPMHEEFKKRGLEQLALVNGVQIMKSEQRCAVCGAVGHLAWECPDTQYQSFKKVEVKCAFCGDMGHVTMDCKLAREQGVKPEELLAKHEAQQRTLQQQHAASNTTHLPPMIVPPPPPPAMAGGAAPSSSYDNWRMDQEYQRMMNELTGKPDEGDGASRAPSNIRVLGTRGCEDYYGVPPPPPFRRPQVRTINVPSPSLNLMAPPEHFLTPNDAEAAWGPVPPPPQLFETSGQQNQSQAVGSMSGDFMGDLSQMYSAAMGQLPPFINGFPRPWIVTPPMMGMAPPAGAATRSTSQGGHGEEDEGGMDETDDSEPPPPGEGPPPLPPGEAPPLPEGGSAPEYAQQDFEGVPPWQAMAGMAWPQYGSWPWMVPQAYPAPQ